MGTRYWIGSTSNDPSDINNWSDASGGATPATSVPGTGDLAVFDANSTNPCVFGASTTLGAIDTQNAASTISVSATFTLTLDGAALTSQVHNLASAGTIQVTGAGHIMGLTDAVTIGGDFDVDVDMTVTGDEVGDEIHFNGSVDLAAGVTIHVDDIDLWFDAGATVVDGGGVVFENGVSAAVHWNAGGTVPNFEWVVDLYVHSDPTSTVTIPDGIVCLKKLLVYHSGAAGAGHHVKFAGDFTVTESLEFLVCQDEATSTCTLEMVAGTGASYDFYCRANFVAASRHLIKFGAIEYTFPRSMYIRADEVSTSEFHIDWGTAVVACGDDIRLDAYREASGLLTGTLKCWSNVNSFVMCDDTPLPIFVLEDSSAIIITEDINCTTLDMSNYTGILDFNSKAYHINVYGPSVHFGADTSIREIDLSDTPSIHIEGDSSIYSGPREIKVDGTMPDGLSLILGTPDTVTLEGIFSAHVVRSNSSGGNLSEHANGGSLRMYEVAGVDEGRFRVDSGDALTIDTPIDLGGNTIGCWYGGNGLWLTINGVLSNGTLLNYDEADGSRGVLALGPNVHTAHIINRGYFHLDGDVTVASFTQDHSDGDTNLDGFDLTATGDIDFQLGTIDADGLIGATITAPNISFSISASATGMWFANASTSLVADSGVVVSHSDASAGVTGDGLAALDGGGNINWNFPGPGSASEAPAVGLGLGIGVQIGRTHPEEAI